MNSRPALAPKPERWRRVAERRAARHAQALGAPATAIPYRGDPRLSHIKPGDVRIEGNALRDIMDPVERFICLYAAAVAKKRGLLPADASGVDAQYEPPSTVIFVQADGSQREVCRFTVVCEAA